jgi:hypothetical protein
MKIFIVWTDTKAGKKIKLQYCGKKEDLERTALDISRVWKSPETNIVIVEKDAERTALSIIRK